MPAGPGVGPLAAMWPGWCNLHGPPCIAELSNAGIDWRFQVTKASEMPAMGHSHQVSAQTAQAMMSELDAWMHAAPCRLVV